MPCEDPKEEYHRERKASTKPVERVSLVGWKKGESGQSAVRRVGRGSEGPGHGMA